jgi:hypothetical protein
MLESRDEVAISAVLVMGNGTENGTAKVTCRGYISDGAERCGKK